MNRNLKKKMLESKYDTWIFVESKTEHEQVLWLDF